MNFIAETLPRGRRRLLAAVPLAVLCLVLAHAGPAAAVGGCGDDPSAPACQPWEETSSATLTLQTPAGIQITSAMPGIDCTGPCSRTASYSRWCYPGDGCGDYAYEELSLGVVNPPSGYAPDWSGCDAVVDERCNLTLDTDHTITVGWIDVAAPSVAFAPPAKAGNHTTIAASGSDNSGSWTYDWTVDGTALAAHGAAIDLSGFAEGDRSVSVRTRDGSGHTSAPITKTVKVDFSVAVSVPAPPAFTNALSVPVGYTTDDDVTAARRQCSVNDGAPVTCAPSFSPVDASSPDGTYAYTVTVTDDVDNTATSAPRSFVLDRTPPVVAFTDGPTEGQAVTTKTATLTFATSDANLGAAAPVCRVDGAVVPCTSATTLVLSKLADGSHVVAVTARDQAGNEATKERRFTVKTETGSAGGTPTGSTGGGSSGGSAGGTGATGGGVLGTGTPGSGRPPVLGAIATGAGWDYAATRTYTILTGFKLKGIPAGAKVVVKCRGASCPKRQFTIKGSGIKPVKLLSDRRLEAGTVIEIWITKPGYIGRVLRIQIRPRKAPASRPQCLPVGATKPVACG